MAMPFQSAVPLSSYTSIKYRVSRLYTKSASAIVV